MNSVHKKIAASRANLPAQNKGSSTRANLPAPTFTPDELRSWESHLRENEAEQEDAERKLSIFRRGLDARELALDSELASITKLQTELYAASARLDDRATSVESRELAATRTGARLIAAQSDWNKLGDTAQELHVYMHGRKGLSKASLAWIDAILDAT